MDVKQAVKIVTKKEPDLVPLHCVECRNWFKFHMGNKDGESIGNGCTYAVDKKTGECGWKSMFIDENFMYDLPLREFNAKEIEKLRAT